MFPEMRSCPCTDEKDVAAKDLSMSWRKHLFDIF
jgi:hypothetical protein